MLTEEASSSGSCTWSWEQEKAFENALVTHSEDCSDRWERIAAEVPGKTAEEVTHHFQLLVEDIDGIESGLVPLPCYASSSEGSADESGGGKKGGGKSGHGKKISRSDQERRKGIAWTEDEHRLFLLGLEKYGKGDWRSISRNFVISRTPTQVASHAQKYFIRLNSMNKDRRRSSIHDITSVDKGDVSARPGPVMGAATGPTSASVKPGKPAAQPPAIGQPVGPLVSAVGTPVSLPPPAHVVYGSRPPAAGTVVPGTPVNVLPSNFSMPRKSSKK